MSFTNFTTVIKYNSDVYNITWTMMFATLLCYLLKMFAVASFYILIFYSICKYKYSAISLRKYEFYSMFHSNYFVQ